MIAFMHTGTRLTAGYRYTTLGDATVRGWVLSSLPFRGKLPSGYWDLAVNLLD